MHRLITISLLLLYSFGLSAQNPHPYFRNYTTDDGLPSSEVHYCIQDTAGYMWFATDNGLSRFDGYEFKNYGPQKGLAQHVIFYMQKDPEGKIWLATMHGHLYYIDKDSIHAFAQNELIEKINAKPHFIEDFYIDTAGTKYLSIYSEGILKFPLDGDDEQILPSSPDIRGLALCVGERWILGTQTVSDTLINPALTPTVITPIEALTDSAFYLDFIPLTNRTISSGLWIKQLNNHKIVGLNSSILYEYEKRQFAWQRQAGFDLELKSFVQDSKDRLLLGLHRGKGIRRYENIAALRENDFEQFLDGISITQIFQDQWGGYWIGTLENGVFYCPDLHLKIYNQSSGFPNDHITALDFKTDQQAFIGFRNGQVILYDFLEGQLDTMPALANNIVYDLLFDSLRQELWATNGQLNTLDKGQWKPLGYSENNTPFAAKRITKSRDDALIWGVSHLGFGSIDLKTKTKYFVSFDLGIRNRTFRVWEDRQGRIWVGNVNGLFEFKNNKLELPQPFHEPFKTRTEDIASLADGTLVIATKGEGVLLWRENNFHQLTTTEGLSSNMLENIYVDEQDQIWAGTLEGLNKITRNGEGFLIKKFTTFHGLPSNEITRVTSHQGQIWVATTKGLLQWREKERTGFSPAPIFEKTLVNNSPVSFPKNPKLAYNQNDVEIHFLTINYNQNGRIPYRFRLNEEDWIYTQNRSVNFANLSPNDYRFEVQSQNENGRWSESNNIIFKIHPAFWQTQWFTFLGISVLLGISWLVYRNRLKQIRQAAKVEQEMNELQRAALRAQMNPHFIFNCLNSIQNFIVQNDQENAARYLAKFAQLIRGILNASLEESISLQDEITLLENYLALEKLRFKSQFNFSIQVDEDLDLFETSLPPLVTQPFVENALIHGFAKMKSGGILKIDFMKKNEKLKILILDNGQGFINTQKQKKTPSTSGLGMSISQKRLELVDALNELEVKELRDENGQVKGTLVTLMLTM